MRLEVTIKKRSVIQIKCINMHVTLCSPLNYKFDLVTNAWSVVPVLGAPPPGRGRSKVVMDKHKLYMLGGWDRSTRFFDFWEFDFITLTWTNLPLQFDPQGIAQHSLAIYKNDLCRLQLDQSLISLDVFGGFNFPEDTAHNKMWKIFLR